MADNQQQPTPKSAKTVTVACKMPGGMRLQHCEPYKDSEPVLGGGRREITVYRKVGEVITVAGCAMPVGGPQPRRLIAGGYALTTGVPADFWDKWFEQNRDADYVKNRIIFAMPSRDAAEAKAEEQEGVKSGLEPLDPSVTTAKDGRIIPADPRYPGAAAANLTAVHTAEKAA